MVRAVALLWALWAIASCPAAPLRIAMLRVHEPSLPRISHAAWADVKGTLARLASDLYGLTLSIDDRGDQDLSAFLSGLGLERTGGTLGQSLSMGDGRGRAAFVRRLERALEGLDLGGVAGYIDGGPRARGRPEAARRLVSRFQERSLALVAELEGQPRSWPDAVLLATWADALRRQRQADLVVTNVPLFYRPADGTALHALVRGGIVGGFTTWQGGLNGHGGSAVVTTFPLVTRLQSVAAVGGEGLDPAAIGRPLGAVALHELMHLIYWLPDNYDHPRCLMHPPAGLDYDRFWFAGTAAPTGASPGALSPCTPCNERVKAREARLTARRLERAGRLEDAIASFRVAIELSGRDPEVQNEAAWLCARTGRWLEEGLGWARKASIARPAAGHILDTLGWIHFRMGQFERAHQWLTRAREAYRSRGSHDATVWYHLACAAAATGRHGESRERGQEALGWGLAGEPAAHLRRLIVAPADRRRSAAGQP